MLWKTFLSSRAREIQLQAVVMRILSRLYFIGERKTLLVATNVMRSHRDHARQNFRSSAIAIDRERMNEM
jgi:hypothetical protein